MTYVESSQIIKIILHQDTNLVPFTSIAGKDLDMVVITKGYVAGLVHQTWLIVHAFPRWNKTFVIRRRDTLRIEIVTHEEDEVAIMFFAPFGHLFGYQHLGFVARWYSPVADGRKSQTFKKNWWKWSTTSLFSAGLNVWKWFESSNRATSYILLRCNMSRTNVAFCK